MIDKELAECLQQRDSLPISLFANTGPSPAGAPISSSSLFVADKDYAIFGVYLSLQYLIGNADLDAEMTAYANVSLVRPVALPVAPANGYFSNIIALLSILCGPPGGGGGVHSGDPYLQKNAEDFFPLMPYAKYVAKDTQIYLNVRVNADTLATIEGTAIATLYALPLIK